MGKARIAGRADGQELLRPISADGDVLHEQRDAIVRIRSGFDLGRVAVQHINFVGLKAERFAVGDLGAEVRAHVRLCDVAAFDHEMPVDRFHASIEREAARAVHAGRRRAIDIKISVVAIDLGVAASLICF